MARINRMALFFILITILVTSNIVTAGGISLTYSTDNKSYFTIAIPDDWKVNIGFEVEASKMPDGEKPKPRLVTLMPNDNSRMWFGMWVPDAVSNLQQAKAYLNQFRGHYVDNAITKEVKKSKVNGMDVTTYIGEGYRDGKVMDIAVVAFQMTPDNMGIAVYIAPPETTKLHISEISGMMKSIKPTL